MIKKILPILLILVAFVGGALAGDMLRGSAGAKADATEAPAAAPEGASKAEGAAQGDAGESGAKAEPDAASHEPTAPHDDKAAAAHAAPAGPEHGGGQAPAAEDGDGGSGGPAATAWYKFPQQFFVPILRDGRLDSTMVLSLSAEMPGTASEKVYAHEIKLRDALLRQLLIEANTGSFDGNFTADAKLRALRASLLTSVQAIVPEIDDVLIGDIARQER